MPVFLEPAASAGYDTKRSAFIDRTLQFRVDSVDRFANVGSMNGC